MIVIDKTTESIRYALYIIDSMVLLCSIQGVVTPSGPVLTTATAGQSTVKRSRVEFWPLLVNGQGVWNQSANLIIRGYPKSRGQRCKIGAVKRSRPFSGGQTV